MPTDHQFVFRHTSDAVLVLGNDDRVVEANPHAGSLLFREVSEIVGRPLEQVLPDFAGSRAQAQLREFGDVGFERRLDHFAPTRYTWYEIRVVPTERRRALFIRDVSERMRQTKTEAVREAVRQIIMDAPVAISITRGAEHRYELVNAMARKLVGRRDLEGRTARSAFPEVDPALFDLLDRVYSSGSPLAIKELDVAFDRDGSGELTPGVFDVTYQPLFEPDGTVSGVMSVAVEITNYVAERRRIQSREGAKSS